MLVAFEGIDGTGKTTQVQLLGQVLGHHGFSVVLTQEPTSGPVGARIREDSLKGVRRPPMEELRMFEADRRSHVAGTISPALLVGDIVITDRYYYSTAAYQGGREGGLSAEEIIRRNEVFAPRPDLLFVFNLSVQEAFERVRSRGFVSSFEDLQGLTRASTFYRSLRGPNVVHIDASRCRDDVQADVLSHFLQNHDETDQGD